MTGGAFRLVMTAPVAAIHALKNLHACKTGIPGPSPGMTARSVMTRKRTTSVIPGQPQTEPEGPPYARPDHTLRRRYWGSLLYWPSFQTLMS
jgi:hypothetical protein